MAWLYSLDGSGDNRVHHAALRLLREHVGQRRISHDAAGMHGAGADPGNDAAMRLPRYIHPLVTVESDHNLKVLEQIQHLDDNRLHELQAANRRIIEQEHTWDKFCTTVWNVIERDLAAEN